MITDLYCCAEVNNNKEVSWIGLCRVSTQFQVTIYFRAQVTIYFRAKLNRYRLLLVPVKRILYMNVQNTLQDRQVYIKKKFLGLN